MDPLGFASGSPIRESTLLVEEAKRLLGNFSTEETRHEIHEVAHEESVIAPPSGGSAAA
jgi:hypothetical protein